MGVSFENAIIGASMCSPSRAAFMTSSYSCQNGVPYVGGSLGKNAPDIPNLCRLAVDQGYAVSWKGKWHLGADPYSGAIPTSTSLDGFISPETGSATTSLEWNPPDAGTTLGKPSTMGGGNAGNDRRFLNDTGDETGSEINWTTRGSDGTFGMLKSLDNYWETYAPNDVLQDDAPPFCLFASFVNPHDCAFFDNNEDLFQLGYPPQYIKGSPINPTAPFNIPLPPNFLPKRNEWAPSQTGEEYPLDHKPTCQNVCCQGNAVSLNPTSGEPTNSKVNAAADASIKLHQNGGMTDAQRFINFYAYLTTIVDAEIDALLNWFGKPKLENGDPNPKYALFEDTYTIRFADHGEQAGSHGLREKALNAYEETINVPFVISNPTFKPSVIEDTVSLMDLVPTVAELMGVRLDSDGQLPASEWDPSYPISGKPLQQYIPTFNGQNPLNPTALHPFGVVFQYDDIFVSASDPSMVRALRNDEWTYAIYYDDATIDGETGGTVQYELYNRSDSTWSSQFNNAILNASVLETNNLAMLLHNMSGDEQSAVIAKWQTMHYTLLGLMANANVNGGTPTIPSVNIPSSDMVNALPKGMNTSDESAWQTFCNLVTPDFSALEPKQNS